MCPWLGAAKKSYELLTKCFKDPRSPPTEITRHKRNCHSIEGIRDYVRFSTYMFNGMKKLGEKGDVSDVPDLCDTM